MGYPTSKVHPRLDAVEASRHIPVIGDPPPIDASFMEKISYGIELDLQNVAMRAVVEVLNEVNGHPELTPENVHALIQAAIHARVDRLPWYSRIWFRVLVLDERTRNLYARMRGRKRNVRWTS